MKNKIPKIILMLSFIPYALVLIYGMYSAFFGFGFLFNSASSYGFGALIDGIFFMTIFLCVYPVIPICLIYQLVYLTVFLIKNRHNISKKTILLIISAVLLIPVIIGIFCIVWC